MESADTSPAIALRIGIAYADLGLQVVVLGLDEVPDTRQVCPEQHALAKA